MILETIPFDIIKSTNGILLQGSLGLIIKIPHELVTKLIVFCNLIHKLLGSAVGSITITLR